MDDLLRGRPAARGDPAGCPTPEGVAGRETGQRARGGRRSARRGGRCVIGGRCGSDRPFGSGSEVGHHRGMKSDHSPFTPGEGVGKAAPAEQGDLMTSAVATDLTAGTWALDPVHSSVNFSVRHLVVSKVRGTFDSFEGTVTVAEDGTPSVTATIDITSVNTRNEQRDAHLKAADFFDAEQFPTASSVSTAVRADGDDYVLDGEFTLKGVTKPVSLKLEFNGVNPGMGHGEVAGFEASVVLNRKDFGIDIDMPLETGGAVVGDKVTITLEIEALKQA